ncbi:MAG: sugar phosphate nucleotidyltransferase, partial [Akkermansiaceae bacterium]|nr:sugar phosphate nucleotidyltransferase [Akkermansiaceae bacterium]
PYEVERFREKPAPELAEQFLREGNFCWNAGMFVWSLPTVIGQLEKHAPDLAEFIVELQGAEDLPQTIEKSFPDQKARSIDYALMESADRVLNIEATFDWDDVGSWISVAKYLETREGDGNLANAGITEFESKDNIVYNARPGSRIALCGVDDLIVVQTGDALLVARKEYADQIKHLTAKLPEDLL